MNIRKRLFRSNNLSTIISLLLIFIAFGIAGSFFRRAFYNDGQKSMIVDDNAFHARELLQEVDGSQFRDNENFFNGFIDQFLKLGYSLHFKVDSEIIYTNVNNKNKGILRYLKFGGKDPEVGTSPSIYQLENTTVLYKTDSQNSHIYEYILIKSAPILAVAGDGYIKMENHITALFIAFCIFFLSITIISQWFTRRMLNSIMIPLNKLTDAAKRIHGGNLDEPIYYAGDDEFDVVCTAFNGMQVHLKKGIEKNEAYEKARTEMFAGISHDLRTPLTSVKGYIKGIQDGVANTPQKQAQYLEIAYQKACDMNELLEKLFLISKLETGDMPLYCANLDLGDYIQKYIEITNPDFGKQGIKISKNIQISSAMVSVDVGQMNRVLTNIIENSGKYKTKDSVDVTISLFEKNNEMVLKIADQGVGVPYEKIPHLFDRFFRGDESRTHYKDGSGLGLSIAKHIVEAHGGRIIAENNKGLTITIFLPITTKKEDYDEADINR